MDEIKPGSIIYDTNPPVKIVGEMTLRDYFAAKAMQSIIRDPRFDINSYDMAVKRAYHIADIMLKERVKNETD